MREGQNYDPDQVPSDLKGQPGYLQVDITGPTGEKIFGGLAEFRRFSTGSYGWMEAGKADLPGSNGRKIQVNVQLVVIGSKPGSDKGPSAA